MKISTDVDIDVFNRDKILEGLGAINARIDRPDGKVEKHLTGVYFQNIPRDPFENLSLVDHKEAGNYGFFKIDFLNVNLYEGVRNESHLLELLDKEPEWELFEYREVTDNLFHLNGYSYLLQKFKPKSVEDLAMILAIIRPAKAHLQQATWPKIRQEVWVKNSDDESYQFKRGHAISYALAIIVHLNLTVEKLSKD